MPKHVVAVYDVDRRFGGREEGGWWYDAGSLVRTMRVFPTEDRAVAYARRLNEKLRSRVFGPNAGKRDIGSVLSEGELQAWVMDDPAPAGFPDRKPRYE
jgi:hypothetical protein